MSLPTQMAIGMVLGIAAGALTPAMGLDPSWYKPVGQLFINLVRMVVVRSCDHPRRGCGQRRRRKQARARSRQDLACYHGRRGHRPRARQHLPARHGLSISTEGLKAKDVAPPTLVDVFLNIVPINPIEALSKGNMLQIIFFALLFGFGLSVIGDKGKQVLHFFDGAADVMIKVTGFVMLYAPIGVFGLMAYTVSMHGLSVLLPLIKLVLVMYLACILQILIVYLPCVKITGLTPSRFLKGLASRLIAFTTCPRRPLHHAPASRAQRRSVSSFSIPLGNTINMDGAAIYLGIAAICRRVYGIPMPLDRHSPSSCSPSRLHRLHGRARRGPHHDHDGLHAGGHPLEAIALVAGVDRIMDMARTTINVLGDATGACLFQSGKAISTPNAANGSLRRITRPETFPGGERRGKFPSAAGSETTVRQDERIGIVGVGPHAGLDLTQAL
ncbi:MAG: dicarboxylate/amino acid:cation symporter [Bilophila wadsworthia]